MKPQMSNRFVLLLFLFFSSFALAAPKIRCVGVPVDMPMRDMHPTYEKAKNPESFQNTTEKLNGCSISIAGEERYFNAVWHLEMTTDEGCVYTVLSIKKAANLYCGK